MCGEVLQHFLTATRDNTTTQVGKAPKWTRILFVTVSDLIDKVYPSELSPLIEHPIRFLQEFLILVEQMRMVKTKAGCSLSGLCELEYFERPSSIGKFTKSHVKKRSAF